MQYDTFLFVGHGYAERNNSFDPGATNGDIKEYEVCKQIVATTLIYLKESNLNIHVDENNFVDNDLSGNKYKYKCGLSVHINSGGGTGSECFVPLKESYFQNDINLLSNLTTLLNIPNRGIKSREYSTGKFITRTNGKCIDGIDYYGEIRKAWEQGISLSLIEIGFIDTTDITKIVDNIDKIAYCIACYICDLCKTTHPFIPDNSGKYRITIDNLSYKESEKICIYLRDFGYKNLLVEYY